MDYRKSFVLATLILTVAFSALGSLQPDSEVVKVVEKDRTTNLMTGTVFEVHFASGGSERFEYVTHRQNYCEVHPESSGCPPEEFPEKPPVMQNFSFEKTSKNPDTYQPQENICIQNNEYQKCRALIQFLAPVS